MGLSRRERRQPLVRGLAVRSLTRSEAIDVFLGYTRAGEVSLFVWLAIGWPEDSFERFAARPAGEADATLLRVQTAMRDYRAAVAA
jgi:hypothetical protein